MQRFGLLKYPHEFTNTDFTNEQIKLIEDTDLLEIVFKLNILQFITNTRQATMLDLSGDTYDDKSKLSVVNKNKITELENLAIKLNLETIYFSNRDYENKIETIQFFVCKNLYIKNYVELYYRDFSHYDYGNLFGYTHTMQLALIYMIEPYLAGEKTKLGIIYLNTIGQATYSKQFFEKEKAYYENIWEQIKNISPKLLSEAEIYNKELTRRALSVEQDELLKNAREKVTGK